MNHFTAQPNPHQARPLITGATLGDYPAVQQIANLSFLHPWQPYLLKAAVLNPHFLVRLVHPSVYDHTKPPVGYYIAHPAKGGFNLDMLAVDPSHRLKGLGRALVTDWLEQGRKRGFNRFTLQVNPVNKVAQTLYADYGFKPVRQLQGYYPSGDSALEYLLVEK